MSVEEELIEASDFKPRRNYSNRQDYLAALARAVDQLGDPELDALSREAGEWFYAAAEAINAKTDIPDFEDEPSAEKNAPDAIAENEGEEAEAAPASKPVKPRKKGQPAKVLKHEPIEMPPEGEDVTLNKYGVVVGSKSAAAISMLEQGCRMADITASIGGTYYSLIKRLVKNGHKLEKASNGVLKLTFVEGK